MKPRLGYRTSAAWSCLRGRALLFNARVVVIREPSEVQITTHDPTAEPPHISCSSIVGDGVSIRIGEDAFTRAARR